MHASPQKVMESSKHKFKLTPKKEVGLLFQPSSEPSRRPITTRGDEGDANFEQVDLGSPSRGGGKLEGRTG